MSSFFNRQSEMFDAKKKRLVGGTSSSATAGEADDRFVIASASDNEGFDSMPESWVELAASRTSLCSSVEAVNMDEANSGSSFNRDSRLSPVSLQSPCVELESNLEQVKYRLAKDVLAKNNDWIWDWSSRPEALPHSGNGANGSQQPMNQTIQVQQIASALTTPPNSPEPDLLMSGRSGFAFSPLKQTKKPSLFSSFLRFEVIVGLVVSNLMTFVLGATIGFCICKKVRRGEPDLLKMSTYNYNRW